jgi:acetyl-CoA carboxylase biotin carboxyl carrier protein
LDLKDIKAIIDLMKKNDLSVFEMEKDGFRLKLQKGPGDQPVISVPATLAPAATTATAPNGPLALAPPAAETASLKDIVSPMVGTFYRGGSPDAPPFVDVGKTVSEDTVVCIIEAMKLMNEIQAEASGEVSKIYVENGQPVEYGQPLFGLKR